MVGADAAVLVTEWPQLGDVDWALSAGQMRRPVLGTSVRISDANDAPKLYKSG
ncbi:hypothetical protein [Streptomyces sp. NPDC048295]|uniref:hypothetical protein n=1 Tax=Streptomyces sp. NPDC048295 TaxID=3154617 RepID=UPI00341A8127